MLFSSYLGPWMSRGSNPNVSAVLFEQSFWCVSCRVLGESGSPGTQCSAKLRRLEQRAAAEDSQASGGGRPRAPWGGLPLVPGSLDFHPPSTCVDVFVDVRIIPPGSFRF